MTQTMTWEQMRTQRRIIGAVLAVLTADGMIGLAVAFGLIAMTPIIGAIATGGLLLAMATAAAMTLTI